MIYMAAGNSSLTSTKKQLLSLPSRKARVLNTPEIVFLETVNLIACFFQNRAHSRARWAPRLVIYELGIVLCLVFITLWSPVCHGSLRPDLMAWPVSQLSVSLGLIPSPQSMSEPPAR